MAKLPFLLENIYVDTNLLGYEILFVAIKNILYNISNKADEKYCVNVLLPLN